jgi:hypothetical protein
MEFRMNNICFRIAITLTLILGTGSALAQDNPQLISIPLSNPGEPMTLDISILTARIEVIGEDREDVEIAFSVASEGRTIITPSGARALPSGSYSLEVDEDDNYVSVDTDVNQNHVTVVVRVPRRANLDLSTTNDGEIIVRDVVGDMQLENTNGPITASNVSGNIIAETINETIDVSFAEIGPGTVMALTSFNGDLKLGLPDNAAVQLHIDNARGEIYSDFEVEVQPSKTIVDRQESRGGIEVTVENAIIVDVNGGGPVVKLKTLNADIHINKNSN